MSQNKIKVKGTTMGGGCDSAIADVHSISPSPSLLNITFVRIGDFNLKPSYNSPGRGEFTLTYSGGFWYIMGAYGSQELAFANPGNEDYPWLATWPEGWIVSKQCPMA